MALARNNALEKSVVDKTLLLALKQLALATEKYRTEVKQLELKISIEKESLITINQDYILELESTLQKITRREKLEAEAQKLSIKLKDKNSYLTEDSERLRKIDKELDQVSHNNIEFRLNAEAKNLLLCLAAYHGLNDSVTFLLNSGASLTSVINTHDKYYPIRLAQIIDQFIRQLDIGIEFIKYGEKKLMQYEKYPLELALAGAHLTTAELLVSAKANVNAAYCDKSQISQWEFIPPTLLFSAAEQGDLLSVEFLTSHGADLNATCKYGQTALHRAANNNHMSVVLCLLNVRADPNIKDKNNRTAADFGLPEIRALIKSYQDKKHYRNCLVM